MKNLPRNVNRLHVRLSLIISGVAVLISALVSVLLLTLVLNEFNKQDQVLLDSRLLSYWAAWQYGGEQEVLDRAGTDIRDHGGRLYLLILFSEEGSILGGFIPGAWEDFDLSRSELLLLTPGSYATVREVSKPYALRVTGVALDNGSRLMVGVSTENRQFLLDMYRRFSPWALGCILILGVCVGLVATSRLLRPIVELNREIDRIIVTGDLSRRLEGRGTRDQLSDLIDRYNRLLDRVESLIGSFRETLDSVAHELRTPLTRLRGHAELALRAGSATDYEEALVLVAEQTDQVSSLLSSLMNISEAEQGVLNLNLVSSDLGKLAAEVCDMYSVIAEEKSQQIMLDTAEPVPLRVDPIRMRQILGNIVDNAVKYTPVQGRISVRCHVRGDWGVATVEDSGPGVPSAEREKIFERLYRTDSSRSSRGLGLGLSVVLALVQAHGGLVDVGDSPLGGAEFTVRIPLAPEPRAKPESEGSRQSQSF